MSELKPGDVVVLRSGGPRMTVNYVVPQLEVSPDAPPKRLGATVYCMWFGPNEDVRRESFSESMLEIRELLTPEDQVDDDDIPF